MTGLPFRPGRHGHHAGEHDDDVIDDELDDVDDADENPDQFSITSVGIDIGSATSHLLVSRLTMRRLGKSMMSRYVVVERETLYRAPISLTPYRPDGLIDAERLQRYVTQCYEESTFAREEIDTGVVLLTGEALRRENSRAIASRLSDSGGRFVCASAGHHLESRVAAYGAGTVERGRASGERLLNLDIGGGTAKLALVEAGEIVATGAVNVGARLIATDGGVVVRVEPAGQWAAEEEGLDAREGASLDEDGLARIARRLARSLMEILAEAEPLSAFSEKLLLTKRVPNTRDVDRVVLSGGVSEFLRDGADPGSYGDLGHVLAPYLWERLAELYGGRVEVSPAGMRATVVGLSQFSVEASGDTIYRSVPSPLPVRNVPLVKLTLPDEVAGIDLADLLERRARSVRDFGPEDFVGVFLDWSGIPRYPALSVLASGLRDFFEARVRIGLPAVVVSRQDCGRSLGLLLQRELGEDAQVVCIDGLDHGEFDFIDIGTEVPGKSVVPVVIKSLLFPSVTLTTTGDVEDEHDLAAAGTT